jgi:hypothetical protein
MVNNCPSMMGCWYDAANDYVNKTDENGDPLPSCHCGKKNANATNINQIDHLGNPFLTTIPLPARSHIAGGLWIGSQDVHPSLGYGYDEYCSELSGQSIVPIILCAINICTAMFCLLKGLYMITVLKKLDQLHMNDITIALIMATIGSVFVLLHQVFEFAQMFLRDPDFHSVVYNNGGALQFCLGGMGLCQVLSSLKIPLLWLMIATSGMDKAKAAKNKKRVAATVQYCSIFFIITFLGIMIVMGSSLGGMYAIFWMIILLAAFQIGSRKLAKQLCKEGEEPPKSVKDMNFYVKRYTVCCFFYIAMLAMYVMNSDITSANPANWSHWAGLIYQSLAQLYVSNFVYIRASLDKKMKKFKETGKVTPSTVVSSSSSSD